MIVNHVLMGPALNLAMTAYKTRGRLVWTVESFALHHARLVLTIRKTRMKKGSTVVVYVTPCMERLAKKSPKVRNKYRQGGGIPQASALTIGPAINVLRKCDAANVPSHGSRKSVKQRVEFVVAISGLKRDVYLVLRGVGKVNA